MKQLDLLEWAESRPTAIILDARPALNRRLNAYRRFLLDNWPPKEIEAEILAFRKPERGAA